MAVYISSINSVSAFKVPATWTCTQIFSNPNYASCNLTAKGVSSTDYNCNYNTKTEKWTCVKAKASSGTPNEMPGSETLSKMTDSQIPLGLRSALDSAVKSDQSNQKLQSQQQAQNGGLNVQTEIR